MKATGLDHDEDHLLTFCGLIVGAGTTDKAGNLEIVGSASGSWQLESAPDDTFTLYRVSAIASYPRFSDLELILESPESGYDWTK